MLTKIENPCEAQTEPNGWKNCSRCKYVDEVTQNYLCLEEVRYQARLSQQSQTAWEMVDLLYEIHHRPSEGWHRLSEGIEKLEKALKEQGIERGTVNDGI